MFLAAVLLDSTRPPVGLASLAAGIGGGLYVVVTKILTGAPVFLEHGSLLLLSALLTQSGILLLGLGVLAEILTRIDFDGQQRRIYAVDRVAREPFRPSVEALIRGRARGDARPS